LYYLELLLRTPLDHEEITTSLLDRSQPAEWLLCTDGKNGKYLSHLSSLLQTLYGCLHMKGKDLVAVASASVESERE
jgi:hypothetical protein